MRKFICGMLLLSICMLTACSKGTVNGTGDKTEQNTLSSSIQESVLNLISSIDISIKTMTKGTKSNEVVVFANFPSREMDLERKLTALRIVNQVIRDNPSVTTITLWDDEISAKEFAEDGAQDVEWEGFNHRVAFANKDEHGTRVFYAIGRDDFEDISFGMAPVE
ncbi:hypothetical protein O3V59_22710 [Brevibacillus thermoruber]|jgi:hypothetical protein|uniref:Lipoprotein n=1 Tax=Brevibacillus thermoruber TaxID=33942 RepID=A0A9X3Z5W8_9BACL|nr:hypothetical protein [Brevibacillus thermoruber]MDA5111140.1 hypothetical protein [Brevibacillus thermoruber]